MELTVGRTPIPIIPPPKPRGLTGRELEERQLDLAKSAYVDEHISLERLEELVGRRLRGEDIAPLLPASPLRNPGKPSTR